jgi:hypothetical protein
LAGQVEFADTPLLARCGIPVPVEIGAAVEPRAGIVDFRLSPFARGAGLADEDRTLPRQQWCAKVIESFLTEALRFREDPKGLFEDYNELPAAICGSIARRFGLDLTDRTKRPSRLLPDPTQRILSPTLEALYDKLTSRAI